MVPCRRRWLLSSSGGIQPYGAVHVCGYDGDLVGVAEGEVGVDEDEDVGDCLGEGEAGFEGGPGAWVGVDDDGEEGGRAVDGGDLVVLRDVDGIHGGRWVAVVGLFGERMDGVDVGWRRQLRGQKSRFDVIA